MTKNCKTLKNNIMISRYQMKSDTEILVLYLISALLSNMTTGGVVFSIDPSLFKCA